LTLANILGLGWACTPAGLKAMEELVHLEEERGNPAYLKGANSDAGGKTGAYGKQYGSVNPAGIIAPAIAATLISTLATVVYCKIKEMTEKKRYCIIKTKELTGG